MQDKYAVGGCGEFEDSSDAYKTETVNTSGLNQSPGASKWNKKKSPLETMTKYETKKSGPEEGKKGYHSRLNSANIEAKAEDGIEEDIVP